MSKHGLGKGLDALIPLGNVNSDEPVTDIFVSEIVPNKFQPRRVFDDEKLADLANSIRQYGVIQPVILRKVLSGYELVAGERRWRAAQLARVVQIPAVVRDYSDAEMTEIALIENLQRQDLNSIEEALAYKRLMEEFGLTQDEVAQKVGRSRSLIANTLRLLRLDPEIQEHVSRGTLTMGQVKPLLAIESLTLQIEAANQIIEEDLSSRDAEDLVRRLVNRKTTAKKAKQSAPSDFFTVQVEDRLKMILGTQVHIRTGKMKSKIEIEYRTADDLERIIEILSAQQAAAATKVTGKLIV